MPVASGGFRRRFWGTKVKWGRGFEMPKALRGVVNVEGPTRRSGKRPELPCSGATAENGFQCFLSDTERLSLRRLS